MIEDLDSLAGEWRSVHNLLMEAAVKARREAGWMLSFDLEVAEAAIRYAESCERVAARLSELRD